MLNIIKKLKFESKARYIILIASVFIYMLLGIYSSVYQKSVQDILQNITQINIDEEKHTLNSNVYFEDIGYIYIPTEDLKSIFENNVYEDVVEKELIITTHNCIKKYFLDLLQVNVNLSENLSLDRKPYINIDKAKYFSLNEILNVLNITFAINISKFNIEELEIIQDEYIKANLKYSSTYVYSNYASKQIISRLFKAEEVYVVLDKRALDSADKYYTIIYKNKDTIDTYIYGKVLKNSIELQDENILKQNTSNIKNSSFSLFVSSYSEQNFKLDKIENICGNANYTFKSKFKLLSNAEISIEDKEKEECKENISSDLPYYYIFTNGYKASGYSNNNVTYAMSNNVNRENIILKITNECINSKAQGVVIDFRDFKIEDSKYFSLFIQELAAMLHMNSLKLIVYIPLNASYIFEESFFDYVDYLIYIEHGTKNENSKTSGTHSSITFVENEIQEIAKKYPEYLDKIILEVPTYSILWIEKNSLAIEAEILSYSDMNSFVTQNNLSVIKDNVSQQNYVVLQKGSLCYKMWLEDEYSILEKISLAKRYNLGGVCLY